MFDNDEQLIANPLGAKLLGITTRTKREWEKNDPDFPATYWFNGRKYNKRRDLIEYRERRRAATPHSQCGWFATSKELPKG
jgi:hypothetical protein